MYFHFIASNHFDPSLVYCIFAIFLSHFFQRSLCCHDTNNYNTGALKSPCNYWHEESQSGRKNGEMVAFNSVFHSLGFQSYLPLDFIWKFCSPIFCSVLHLLWLQPFLAVFLGPGLRKLQMFVH